MRWVRWTGGGLLLLLLSIVGWRLSLGIPERVDRAAAALVAAAAREGVAVQYGGLKLHLLHLHISIDNVVLRDALADLPLGSARSVDVSFSPLRFLTGDLPVSRVRVRNFRLEAGERNRALYDRWMATRKEGPRPSLPEILLMDGSIHLTLPGPLRRFQAVIREVRVREVRFLGTHVTASLEQAEGDVALSGDAGGVWPFPSVEADLIYKEGVLRVRKFKAARDSAALRLSGSLDTRKRIASAKASGELDIAGWIAAGAPGGFVRAPRRQGGEGGVLRHRRRTVGQPGSGGPSRLPERRVSRLRRGGRGGATLPASSMSFGSPGRTRNCGGGCWRRTDCTAPSPGTWRGRRPCGGFPSPRSPGKPSVFPSRLPGPETLPPVSRERRIASRGPSRLRSPAALHGFPRREGTIRRCDSRYRSKRAGPFPASGK